MYFKYLQLIKEWKSIFGIVYYFTWFVLSAYLLIWIDMGDKNIDGQIYEIDSHKKLLNWIVFQKQFRYQIDAVNLIGYP